MNGTEKKDRDLLIEGLQRMDLKLSDQVIDQLMSYLNLVEKWNRVYNLTAIRERDEMIKLHFLDSLSILNHVHVKNILDVGSGAGFPGIVLAITKPELKVTVMDAVNKKTTFMQQVKSELALNNLNVKKGVCGIIEEIRHAENIVNVSTVIVNGFRRAGIVIKVEPKISLSELTFLKISVINSHSFTNLGPLFRKLGRYQDGLTHTAFNLSKKEFDSLTPAALLELHLKTVVSSFQYEPHSPLHNALRSRIGLEPMETLIQYEHLSERYRQISLSDWNSLESILHTLQVGHEYHSSAVKIILAVDYGNLPCKG